MVSRLFFYAIFMKRNAIYLILTIFTTFCLQSCYTTHNLYGAIYDIGLSSVESPADAKTQFGETKVVNYTENEINKYRYEDDYIDITWTILADRFEFELKNKTDYTMKINWDEISFVTVQGDAKRVIHEGIKYTDRSKEQAIATIPRGSKIVDFLVPAENIYYNDVLLKWKHRNIIPISSTSKEDIQRRAEEYKNGKMSIMMPLQIENIQNDYLFEFEVGKNVRIEDQSYKTQDIMGTYLLSSFLTSLALIGVLLIL